ncbi:hypothetical protein ACQQXA_004949, partial [Escherichia coli]
MNQNDCSGKTLKLWPVFVDHYNVKVGGSIESKLEKLVLSVVEKELLSKTPEELSKCFNELGVG